MQSSLVWVQVNVTGDTSVPPYHAVVAFPSVTRAARQLFVPDCNVLDADTVPGVVMLTVLAPLQFTTTGPASASAGGSAASGMSASGGGVVASGSTLASVE